MGIGYHILVDTGWLAVSCGGPKATSLRIVGWSMDQSINQALALRDLLMAANLQEPLL